MKKLAGAIFTLIFIAGSGAFVTAQETSIDLPEVPATIEEFVAFRDATATTPEGGAAVFVLAMLQYVADEKLGLEALTVALDRYHLSKSNAVYRGFGPGLSVRRQFKDYLGTRPYLAASYVAGTSPDTGYQLPEQLKVSLSRNAYSNLAPNRIKVFVACSGAASPRPMTLQVNNRGIWKAYEFSSFLVGVRPPVEAVDDDL